MQQSANKVSSVHTAMLVSAVFVAMGLSACEKPTVVNVPAATVAVPGPAGAPGAAGNEGSKGESGVQGVEGSKGEAGVQGLDGNKGETGKSGDGTTVIVTPPAN